MSVAIRSEASEDYYLALPPIIGNKGQKAVSDIGDSSDSFVSIDS